MLRNIVVWWHDVPPRDPFNDRDRIYFSKVRLINNDSMFVGYPLGPNKHPKPEEIREATPTAKTLVTLLNVNGIMSIKAFLGYRLRVSIALPFSFEGEDGLGSNVSSAWITALNQAFPGDKVTVTFRNFKTSMSPGQDEAPSEDAESQHDQLEEQLLRESDPDDTPQRELLDERSTDDPDVMSEAPD